MAKLKWHDGRVFELVETTDFLVAEGRWVEKQSGTSLNELLFTDTVVARVLVTLRRSEVMLAWRDFDSWTFAEIHDLIEDDEPAEPEGGDGPEVPTAAGAEAGGASVTSSTRGGSTSSSGTGSTPETSTD